MKKQVTYLISVLIITLCLAEATLRLISNRKGHIDYLFGKTSYFLPPFHVPEKVPVVDTTKWFKYNVYDSQLGWSIGKLGAQPPYYSNQQGYRCSKGSYDSLRHKTVVGRDELSYDIVCIGNSFTHGDEVAFEQTWPYLLGEQTGFKVLNLGVGGYGIDQAWLRYEKEKPKSNLVILGLVAGDLDRATSQIYNMMAGGLKTKPMYVQQDDELRVVNRPAVYGSELMKEFSKGDKSEFLGHERDAELLFGRDWYTRLFTVRTYLALKVWERHRKSVYRTEGEELDRCLDLISMASERVREDNVRFVVLLLDNLNTFVDWRDFGNPWGIFIKKLEERGIEYWYYGNQLYVQFVESPDAIINKGLVHYTPIANGFVAEFVSQKLNNESIDPIW